MNATPMITALRSMIAWSIRLAALLMFCAACSAQAAEQVTIADLTARADAGDRTAMRALADAY